MDDRTDVRTGAVDLGVHDRFEMVVGSCQGIGVIEVEGDDVLRLHFVERRALALDPDRARAGLARADVAERQVDVSLERDDATGQGDLFPQDRTHDPCPSRRSVGG